MIEISYQKEEHEELVDLRSRVETICECAKADVQLRPETILKIFGYYEDAASLEEKHAEYRREWDISRRLTNMALGGDLDVDG